MRITGWTPDQDAELRQLAEAGMTIAHIADQVGRSRTTVGARAKFLGLEISQTRPARASVQWTDDDRATLKELRREGFSVRLVAIKMCRLQKDVLAEFARLGMATR